MSLISDFKLPIIIATFCATIIYIWLLYRVVLRRKVAVRSDFLKLFPAAITVMAAMLSLIFFFIQSKEKTLIIPSLKTQSEKTIFQLQDYIKELESSLISIESRESRLKSNRLKSKTNVSNSSVDTAINNQEIAGLKDMIQKNTEAINKFSGLLLSEPEQLITLPLLQKDITLIKDDISTVKSQVKDLGGLLTETAGQNRWVIGTLALVLQRHFFVDI